MSTLDNIVHDIEMQTGLRLTNYSAISIGGGCINSAYKLTAPATDIFIKLNQPSLLHMFEAEVIGLQQLSVLKAVRVPDVVCYGKTEQHSYIAMEYIELSPLNNQSASQLGQQLAQQHHQQQDFFGWQLDNTIGSTPQANQRHHDWLSFWQQQRLQPQFQLAQQNGLAKRIQDKGAKLTESIAVFFDNYSPSPALLHGDLWAGNAAADSRGNPVIFDPASYYGDREADLAMTELFGGFNNDFYSAYQAETPLDPGYKVRKTLYNLYHILNHFNLFGGSYSAQAESMIDQLLAET